MGLDELDLVVGNRPLHDGAVRCLLGELPIKDKSKIRELPLPSHHLAHAGAGYYTSPFDDAAVLVVDGIGSRIPGSGRLEKHTVFAAEGTKITLAEATSYAEDFSDIGLGLFYEFFTAKLGSITKWGHENFGLFSCGGYLEAGKTMGLAPYGRPCPDWGQLLQYDGADVGVKLSMLERSYEEWYAAEGDGFDPRARDAWRSQFAKDVARKAQDELEDAMLYLARKAREITGARNLCLNGGVGLNSVANQRIAAEAGFDGLYIAPPAGDAGIAIGAAAYGYYEILGGTERHHAASAATGRTYTDTEIRTALDDAAAKLTYQRAPVAQVAELLASHHVVAWVQGGSEIGPRALGQRSLLAAPVIPTCATISTWWSSTASRSARTPPRYCASTPGAGSNSSARARSCSSFPDCATNGVSSSPPSHTWTAQPASRRSMPRSTPSTTR